MTEGLADPLSEFLPDQVFSSAGEALHTPREKMAKDDFHWRRILLSLHHGTDLIAK